MSGPLLEVEHLRTWFPVRGGVFLRAQAHVTSTFDASVVVSKIEALYQDVTASQRGGADRG